MGGVKDEDLCVPNALTARLRMYLVSILPNDSVERGNGETCESTVITDDVVARPDTHEAILANGLTQGSGT